MVLDPISQSLPVHFFGSRPQPPTSPARIVPHPFLGISVSDFRKFKCTTHKIFRECVVSHTLLECVGNATRIHALAHFLFLSWVSHVHTLSHSMSSTLSQYIYVYIYIHSLTHFGKVHSLTHFSISHECLSVSSVCAFTFCFKHTLYKKKQFTLAYTFFESTLAYRFFFP